ncbi:hypothetical protein NL676_035606 [Syzygium grande]|nr:hypothetical protein NL676_035606 [Syzygium grande]
MNDPVSLFSHSVRSRYNFALQKKRKHRSLTLRVHRIITSGRGRDLGRRLAFSQRSSAETVNGCFRVHLHAKLPCHRLREVAQMVASSDEEEEADQKIL